MPRTTLRASPVLTRGPSNVGNRATSHSTFSATSSAATRTRSATVKCQKKIILTKHQPFRGGRGAVEHVALVNHDLLAVQGAEADFAGPLESKPSRHGAALPVSGPVGSRRRTRDARVRGLLDATPACPPPSGARCVKSIDRPGRLPRHAPAPHAASLSARLSGACERKGSSTMARTAEILTPAAPERH